jgi:CDGSH-type Zn-finger protein
VVPATPGVLAGRQGHSGDVSRSLSAEPDLPEDGGATITPYRDGPLIVRGPVRLQDQHGGEIVVERETIALCRCGRSRTKPFCDASHRRVGFVAEERAGRPRPG